MSSSAPLTAYDATVFRRLTRTVTNRACLEWIGPRDASGRMSFHAPSFGSTHEAADAAYRLAFGPPDPGLIVRQTCDNAACVLPRHLTAEHPDNVHGDWKRVTREQALALYAHMSLTEVGLRLGLSQRRLDMILYGRQPPKKARKRRKRVRLDNQRKGCTSDPAS